MAKRGGLEMTENPRVFGAVAFTWNACRSLDEAQRRPAQPLNSRAKLRSTAGSQDMLTLPIAVGTQSRSAMSASPAIPGHPLQESAQKRPISADSARAKNTSLR
jgi:hypothetical protein